VISRRAFLAEVGGAGLTLAFAIPDATRPAAAAAAFEPNTWLTIAPDGVTTVHVAVAEMGQGAGTAWAQIVAEELEVDWKDVRIDYPILGDPKYGRMQTSGSQSISEWFDVLSRAGAAARLALVDAAARHWGVDASDCVAERGAVKHPGTARSLSYGELVTRVPITKTLTSDELKAIPLKKADRYRLIGRPIPRLDVPEKVDGRATFGIDVFLPGMAYAKVAYPPTRDGGKHRAVDDTAARQVKGHLQTIVTDDLVAVVAETYEAAVAARDALTVTWDLGPRASVDSTSIAADYERRIGQEAGAPFVGVGDAAEAMGRATRTHAARYRTDFAMPAPMEPMNCVALWVDDRCELFTGTQSHFRALRVLSTGLGIPAAKIRIHQHYLGGGFGQRLEPDVMLEAALISRAAGRPIKLIRSREEDFGRAFPRTPTLHAMRAGLDAAGKIVAWKHVVVAKPFVPLGNPNAWTTVTGSRIAYQVPNQSVRVIEVDHGIPVGAYRSIGAGYTSFAVEAFVDEVARLTGTDPLAFRLEMLQHQPRLANVLKLATARAGWGAPLPPDVGRGLACTTYPQEPPGRLQTSTAAVVQARVDRGSGEVRVEKITCAVDCGLVINPGGVRAQLEGGLLFGLSAALKERATVTNGAFDQKNFEEYPVLRMDEVPEVELHVVESTDQPSGAGEPTTTVVAPALANAIFAATGARVRNLPFVPERVLKAMRDRP
jgi:isoquinoline 1-oxidoreductase beta subunit